jgi:hypothetical protein
VADTDKKDDQEDMKDILDDDDIRNYFKSRDPERKHMNPGLTPEISDSMQGKASVLKTKETPDEEIHGVSFTQHTKSINNTKRHFGFLGAIFALIICIILVYTIGE